VAAFSFPARQLQPERSRISTDATSTMIMAKKVEVIISVSINMGSFIVTPVAFTDDAPLSASAHDKFMTFFLY
jgi:hypothetical protein